MGSFEDVIRKALEEKGKEAFDKAVKYARYKTQEDFNTELIKEITAKTGHKNFAATVFVETNLESDGTLDYEIFTEEAWINGMYESNSSFHKGFGGWSPIEEHYGMSKYEFWELKSEGYEGHAGGVDPDWLVDNFWKGIEFYTNGWPRGAAEYLFVGTRRVVSADAVATAWINKYKSNKIYQKYIIEALGK